MVIVGLFTENQTSTYLVTVTSMSWPEHTYNLPRFSAVINACKQLDYEGKPITNEAVRAVVGGGSLRDISPIVRSYIEQQDVTTQFEQLKPDFAHLLLAAADDAFGAMRGHLNNAIEQSQSTVNSVSAEYIEREREKKEELARLNAELGKTSEQLAAAIKATGDERARADALSEEMSSLKSACTRQATDIDRLNELLANTERRCSELITNHTDEQQRLYELQENETSRLMQIIDNNSVKHAREIQELNERLFNEVSAKTALANVLASNKTGVFGKQPTPLRRGMIKKR